MQVEKLRSLIRESIQEYIKEIDEAAETAAMEARIAKCDEAILARETRLENLRNLEEAAGMLDEVKVKAMENEIKELKKAKAKFEKAKEKRATKLAGKGKKEVTTDAKTEDTPVDESDVMKKMEMEGDMPKEEALNESFLKMQKLAGVITEAQYNQKKKVLIEAEDVSSKQDISPEEAVKKVMPIASKLENSPELDTLAQKIAKDPNLMAQLEKALKTNGIETNLTESENELDSADMKTLMLNLAKKGEQLQERISSNPDEDTSSAGLGMASFVVGGVIGGALKTAILAAVPAAASLFAGPAIVGAAVGLGLFLLARKVYLAAKEPKPEMTRLKKWSDD
jgi:hypothetical protein